MLRVCVVQGRDLPQADFATGASDPVRVLKINIFEVDAFEDPRKRVRFLVCNMSLHMILCDKYVMCCQHTMWRLCIERK
jgi:hypothetical protein